jgi:hypothetical protein
MTSRFRPQMEALESREVPAAFSAHLADGSNITGIFTTPPAVDPSQGTQQFTLTDLTVTRSNTNNATYTVLAGAQATYSNGALVSVTGVAQQLDSQGHVLDQININGTTVQDGSYLAPLALDGAETQLTLTLPDGTVGTVSFTIPWTSVDPTQSSQGVAPTTFNVNIAGQNYTLGSATFTNGPMLGFSHGDLMGLSFAVTTPNSPYLSVSFSGPLANGIANVQIAPNQFVVAPTKDTGPASITLDFANVPIPATGTKIYTLKVRTQDSKEVDANVEIAAGATAAQLRDLFSSTLDGLGIVAKDSGATGLNIRGSATSPLKSIEPVFGTVSAAPKLIGRTPAADGTTYPSYNP